jgi:hypothetical protein
MVRVPLPRPRTIWLVALSRLVSCLLSLARACSAQVGPAAQEQVSAQATLAHVHTVHRCGCVAFLHSRARACFLLTLARAPVWQLWSQTPQAFEFDNVLLLFLLESVYSARFGSFLADCQKDRIKGNSYLLATRIRS